MSSLEAALAHHEALIGEGVEREEQLALLRGFGCDQVQGFLVSKPLPVGELIEFLLDCSRPKLVSL